MSFRKINTIAGFLAGAVATIVYLLTLEPTASFWDCGEFIPAAYKLEVAHAPGAPFLMLIQRLASMMAGGNVKNVALCINAWSAIASGLTIAFLFWTITAFAKKLLLRTSGNEASEESIAWEPDTRQTILLLSAGFIGALAYTFSDTFWFSAVEAEVYATSSLFTASVFWAMLQWDARAAQPGADRWLVMISFMIGISTGVHLLCLLAIPAMVMVYYFRRYPVTLRGGIIAFFAGCAALGFVQYGIIQGIPLLASSMDFLAVNSFGLPFDSGAVFTMVLVAVSIFFLLKKAKEKRWYDVHTAILCVAFMLIGLLSYVAPILRSRADVPLDMTNPDNTRGLVSYLRREMFGSQHLFYGRDFDATVTGATEGEHIYVRAQQDGKDVYKSVGRKRKLILEEGSERVFPRVWATLPEAARYYRYYLGLEEGQRPDGGDNLKFFFQYQINWMWWRYFMWNFVGRQNDLPGNGDPKSGNWASGLPAVDRAVSFGTHDAGDASKMSGLLRNNAARNELYYLPLLLGLAGLVYQCRRRSRDAIVLGILFFFAGVAVVIYVNTSPLQDAERDYAFSGSFYTFAIWIGLGVVAIHQAFSRLLKARWNVVLTALICMPVPLLMGFKEWDDHDRSGKTLARDIAYNTLTSCAPNAVLFTNGDNLTYPLYYLQEVEGIRKDVRVVCFPLLMYGWYLDQLSNRINDADPVPIAWSGNEFLGESPDNLSYLGQSGQASDTAISSEQFMAIRDFCRFVVSDKKIADGSLMVNYVPSRHIVIPGPRGATDSNVANADMYITFNADKLIYDKSELAELAIISAIAEEGWKRPVYFTDLEQTTPFGNLNDFMTMEGTVYRLIPSRIVDTTNAQTRAAHTGSVDLAKSYELFTQTYLWGGANRSDIYFDETARGVLANYRMAASRIAGELTAGGRKNEALQLLDAISRDITETAYPYDVTGAFLASSYYSAGGMKPAAALGRKVVDNASADMEYLASLRSPDDQWLTNEIRQNIGMMKVIAEAAIKAGDANIAAYAIQRIDNTRSSGIVPVELVNQLLGILKAMQK